MASPAIAVMFVASKGRGQWLFVMPKYDMVVAVNARITSGSDPALDLLFRTIRPAVR